MNNQLLRDIALGVLFVVLDLLFFQHLPIFGARVDPLIFYLMWLNGRYDRVPLLFIAAGLGLMQDAFFDFWGIGMFAKTLLVFGLHNFVKQRSDNQLLLWQIFVFIFAAAVIHNIIFFALSSFFIAYATNFSPFTFVVGDALYTAMVGALIYVFRIR